MAERKNLEKDRQEMVYRMWGYRSFMPRSRGVTVTVNNESLPYGRDSLTNKNHTKYQERKGQKQK